MTQSIAVLFDFDGTLVTHGVKQKDIVAAVSEILYQAGVSRDVIVRNILVDPPRVVEQLSGRLNPESRKGLLQKIDQEISFWETRNASLCTPIPGVQSVIEYFHTRRTPLAIFTRTSLLHLEMVLQKHNLGPFDVLLTRESGPLKPDPAQVVMAARQLGIPCEQLVVVGDHPFDMQAGLKAGGHCVGVLTGSGKRDELLEAGAVAVLEGVWQLPDYLEGVLSVFSGHSSSYP